MARRVSPLRPPLAANAVVGAVMVALLSACPPAPGPGSPRPASTAVVPSFDAGEEAVLRRMAVTDRRLARRFAIEPSKEETDGVVMRSLLEGTGDTNAAGAGLDVLAFDDRARILDEAGRTARALVPRSEREASERRLLVLVVAEERRRVDRERSGAGGVVLSLEALAASVGPDDGDRREGDQADDRTVRRQLTALRATVAAAALTTFQRDAIDDTLDPLERVLDRAGARASLGALAALRVDLTNHAVVSRAAPSADGILRQAIDDAPADPASSRGTPRDGLEASRASFGRWLDEALPRIPGDERRLAMARGAAILRAPATCPPEAPSSRLRSADPPPEREGLRGIVCALSAVGPVDPAAVIAAHDAVTMALWALDVHERNMDPYRAEAARALRSSLDSGERGRALRRIVVAPAAAITAGLGVALLALPSRGDASHREAPVAALAEWQRRAATFRAFGDAPLEIVADLPPPR